MLMYCLGLNEPSFSFRTIYPPVKPCPFPGLGESLGYHWNSYRFSRESIGIIDMVEWLTLVKNG